MSEAPKEYRIRTVGDFLAIPAERRDVAIREFDTWCAVADFALSLGIPAPDHYHWIDDDKGEATFTLTTPDGEPVFTLEVKPAAREAAR